jgi:hypothetical protein
MKIEKCLLCNEPLIDKATYKSEKKEFNDNPKFKHKEHIIQNALGGRLKSESILCEECGGILNEEIDKNFLILFHGFTEKLKNILPKERNKNAYTPVKGFQVDSKKEIIYFNNIISPKKPEYKIIESENKIIIYSNKKSIENYKRYIDIELKKSGKKLIDFEIEEITQFEFNDNIGLNFSEGVENFNEKWKLGFIKIATEFAFYNGIDRNQLTRTIDFKNKKLIHTNNVFPFYPIGLTDLLYELNRTTLERNYPTHTLILFTQKLTDNEKSLICYVDLFSTFQFYVILNEKYVGKDIFKTYCQKLKKEKRQEINFRKIKHKDLKFVAEDIGINFDKFSGDSYEELYDFLENEYSKVTPNYELNLSEELNLILSKLSSCILLSDLDSRLINLESIEILNNLSKEWKIDIMLELKLFFNQNETIKIERYRQKFLEKDANGGYELLSTPNEIATNSSKYIQWMREYGHLKFHYLTNFTEKMIKK